MSLGRHEQRALRRIDRALSRSAPRVHAEFWAFGRVWSGQARPGWEQVRPGRGEQWRTLRGRISHGALLALMYASGITSPRTAADEADRQAGKR